jgi:hypothetical protein
LVCLVAAGILMGADIAAKWIVLLLLVLGTTGLLWPSRRNVD